MDDGRLGFDLNALKHFNRKTDLEHIAKQLIGDQLTDDSQHFNQDRSSWKERCPIIGKI